MSNYFDLNGGGNYFDLAVGNYFDLDGGGNYFDISGTPDTDDVISIDGFSVQRDGYTINFGGIVITRNVGSESITEFNLEKYNDRLDDRKYYRRNRTP